MYKTIVHKTYQLYIWEGCEAVLQTNGKRYRCRYDYAHWEGDTCSCRARTVYMSMADGERVLGAYNAACREMQSDDPRGHTPLEVLCNQLGSNYSPNNYPVPTYRR